MDVTAMDADADCLPRVANVELTNRCNLKCTFCANRKMKRPRGDMSRDVLDIVLNRLAEAGVLQVNLNTVGETLDYPDLRYAIEGAKSRGFFVLISTNGQSLSLPVARMLVETRCDLLRLSVNAGNAQTYEKIHRGGEFSTLVRNVEALVRVRNETQSPLAVRLRAVVPRNAERADATKRDMASFWSARVDQIEYVMFGNMGGRNGARPLKDSRRVPCATIWRGVNVMLNGSVSYCACDFDAEAIIGSLLHASLEDIWSQKRYREVRMLHQSRDFGTLIRCQECDATRGAWYDRKVLAVSLKEAAIMDQYFSAWRQRSLSADGERGE